MSSSIGRSLSIHGLEKRFTIDGGTVQALTDLNLDVDSGEFLCVVGASGCGKSTLLRLIGGLEDISRGRILLDGIPIGAPSIDRGMVFQEARLLPWLTAAGNIAFGCRSGIPGAAKRRLVEDHIALVGLDGFANAYPHQLSGGMQQRVSIARALVNHPKVLLLDEPFGALDALTRIQMQQEILRIRKAEKTTMILVTHDIDEAIYLGDRVVVMTNRPGTIRRIVAIDLPRPRDRSSLEFVKIRKEIFTEFFGEVRRPFAYAI